VERHRLVPADRPGPAADAMRGEVAALGTPEEIAARWPSLAPEILAAGDAAALCAPLRVGETPVGVLYLGFRAPQAFPPDVAAFLVALADLAGQALERAGLYEAQRHIAPTLQPSLLPPELPAVPGCRVAARYVAAGAGNEVGGDFYDLFPVEDGWALVMGDVCGKGPEAAALTALVRYTLRAEAGRTTSPAETLHRVNAAILRQREDRRFCTVVHGVFTPDGRGGRVVLATGGHPPALVLRRDRRTETVRMAGTVLGFYDGAQVAQPPSPSGPVTCWCCTRTG
jgi:hypothetical protein